MLELLTPSRVGLALFAISLIYILRFLQKLHYHRTIVKGLSGPPHSYLWGSLQAFGEVTKDLPKRIAPQCIALPLKEKFNLGNYAYIDPFPFGDPLLMIFDADMMNEITVKQSLPKHPEVDNFVQHVGGRGNLVSAEGSEWKKWRAAFNSGFAVSNLMTYVPLIVSQCEVFCSIMSQHAKNNDLFRMEKATTSLTVDIIGKVVLDLDFSSQKGRNELVDAFNNQVKWIPIGAQFNPWELVDFRRPFMLAYNTWRMNRYLGKALDERFATRSSRGKTKHVIDLALETYLKEVKGGSGDVGDVKTLDPEFKTAAISNLKVFIFAGHDTTSSTICYAYYYISKDPTILQKVRKEMEEVFGSDPKTVPEQLRKEPYLLNKLEYTTAAIREVLRLQPPASTIRVGQKGFFLHDPETGESLPTEGFMLWPVDVGFGRSSKYWHPDRHAFRPERYLDPQGYEKDAWIPFSKGVRNCIGQELALLEVKVILAMTIRTFDFEAKYDELHKLRGDESGYPSEVEGVQQYYGEEAYQIQLGAAKPREGMPCRIRARG